MHYKLLQCHTYLTVSGNGQPDPQPAWSVSCDTHPPSVDGPGYPLPCLSVIEPPARVCSKEGGEAVPRTYGPWPGVLCAVTPVRKPFTPAVSGISLFSNPRNLESDFQPLNRCRIAIILLSWSIFGQKSVKYPISTAIFNCRQIAARCRHRARLRRFSVASFVMDFSPVPLKF